MDSLISIVIPVSASHRNTLPQALASIEQQTIAPDYIHTIVVNDSGHPLPWQDRPGRQLIDTDGYRGTSVARNLGIEQVRTPFTLFLDADDLLINTTLETTLRAYAWYGAGYIYGDSWTLDQDRELGYYAAPMYDRALILNRNLHNVTALVPTEFIRKVGGFDENIRGWEDWEFYIRLGLNGICGQKVPSPLILYRLALGQNRNFSATIGNEIRTDMIGLYGDYIKGSVLPMGCCGTNPNALNAAQAFMRQSPMPTPADGLVVVEYTGDNIGAIPFRVNGNTYRGGNNDQDRFVRVKVEDVGQLISYGMWRLVPVSAMQARRPPADLETPAPGITTPATAGAAGVTKPADPERDARTKTPADAAPKAKSETSRKRKPAKSRTTQATAG